MIRTVRASAAVPVARLAFEFLVLTEARWGEVRWGRVVRDRSDWRCVDHLGQADESEPPELVKLLAGGWNTVDLATQARAGGFSYEFAAAADGIALRG